MPPLITEYPQFFTATNLEWKPLLHDDRHKEIIIDSLRFLVAKGRILLYGFVIMPNHIHLIWQMGAGCHPSDVQRDFLKYTAQTIKACLLRRQPEMLASYKVQAKDRAYQFWERNPLSVEIWSEKVLLQKLSYIHLNPVRAGLCDKAVGYRYSSARLYESGVDDWGFITHFKD